MDFFFFFLEEVAAAAGTLFDGAWSFHLMEAGLVALEAAEVVMNMSASRSESSSELLHTLGGTCWRYLFPGTERDSCLLRQPLAFVAEVKDEAASMAALTDLSEEVATVVNRSWFWIPQRRPPRWAFSRKLLFSSRGVRS